MQQSRAVTQPCVKAERRLVGHPTLDRDTVGRALTTLERNERDALLLAYFEGLRRAA